MMLKLRMFSCFIGHLKDRSFAEQRVGLLLGGVEHLRHALGEGGVGVGKRRVVDHGQLAALRSQRSERAWRESGLSHNNMEFHVAYPEDLARIGIEDDSLDMVFVNSVINLAYDYERAFAEMFRVLKPGGLLICETVLSNAERDETVMSAAREIGNNVQSAPSKRYFEELLAHLGFGAPDYLDATMVAKDVGFKHTYSAPVVETDEEALFVAAVAYIRKPD